MQDLINTVAEKVGLDPAVAEKAVGMIIGFLQKNGPEGAVSAMMENLPGAAELAATHAPAEGGGGGLLGGLMGMMGGGGSVMALGQQLMSEGVSMGQIGDLSKEVFSYAKEQVGEEKMGEIVASIPGLSQFV